MRKELRRYIIFASIFLLFAALSVFFAGVNAAENCNHQDVAIDHKEPTEDTDGYTTYRCELCGDEYTVIIFASGHNWSDWVVVKEPTKAEPGLRYRTCGNGLAHTEWAEIPALDAGKLSEIISETQVDSQLQKELHIQEQELIATGGSFRTADIAVASVSGGIGLAFLLAASNTAFVSIGILRRHKTRSAEIESERLESYKRGREIWHERKRRS